MRRILQIILIISFVLITGCSDNAIEPVTMEVEKQESSNEIYNYLNQYLDYFYFDNKELLMDYMGMPIKWDVIGGDAHIENGYVLCKDEAADEYEKIKLQASVDGQIFDFDEIVLLDEKFGYLITYFSGNGEQQEQLKLAFTYDGLLWFELNDQKSVLKPTIGTQRLRDPSLVRNKDGGFFLLATQGYDNPSIYVYDTNDFINYENERLLKVNASSEDNKMSEKQAWAPEGFYDRLIDKYVIYYSSVEDGGMFYNYSSDMYEISYPKKLLDTGFAVIDGTIFKNGYNYSIVLKDEREPMEEYSQLFVGYSDSDYLHFDRFDMNYITGHQSEGPFIMHRGGDNYILYYDDYTRFQFKALTFSSMEAHDFKDVPMEEIISSVTNVKHASAMAITYKEYLRMEKKYAID